MKKTIFAEATSNVENCPYYTNSSGMGIPIPRQADTIKLLLCCSVLHEKIVTQLNVEEIEQASGGILFMAVPAYFAVGVIMGELAIIGAIYKASK